MSSMMIKKRVELFYPFFLILFIVGCNEIGWTDIEYYKSGNVKVAHLILNSQDSSFLVKEYYEGGELKSFFEYENGKIEGHAIGYYENGSIANKLSFVEGKINGIELRYSPEGVLKARFLYSKGIRYDGCFYYDNGQPTANLSFDSLGRIKSGVYYYQDGILRSDGSFSAINPNQKEGYWRYFYENGNLKEEGEYKSGVKRGDWIMYDSIGNIKMVVPYH